MNRIVQRVVVVMLVVLVVMVAGAQLYKVGERHGYSAGWSDAQCGPGRECEAGQE